MATDLHRNGHTLKHQASRAIGFEPMDNKLEFGEYATTINEENGYGGSFAIKL